MAQYTGTDGLTYTALETAAGVNLTINGNGPSYSMINGVLSISGGSVDFKTTLYSVSVGAGVTSLGPNMFTGCTNLYAADISASTLTTIGYMAFDGCTALVSIGSTLPASLTTISDYAFSDCSSLRNIKFTSSVTSIGQSAFYGCSSLTITDFDKTNIPEKDVKSLREFGHELESLLNYPSFDKIQNLQIQLFINNVKKIWSDNEFRT